MEIRSAVPGNLFVHGKPVVLEVSGAATPTPYELVDYHGAVRRSGEALGKLDLGALPPGWYELRLPASAESAYLGVLVKGSGDRLPPKGKVCVDTAASGLVRRERWAEFAGVVRRAGFPWVRERLRWNQVEPREGEIDWGKYHEITNLYMKEGIRVCQAWHDAPAWTRTATAPDSRRGPGDLRAAYRFARAAASEFRKGVQAWEVWNEPDIFFWEDSSAQYAGLLRATVRGLRDGNPKAIVLSGSLCSGVTPFATRLFASGAMEGCDRFNWHLYKPPEDYPGELDGYRRLAARSGPGMAPAWMTEAGIRLAGTEGEGKRLLDTEALREQARFTPRSVAMSLAAGDERHFFFVAPHYLENGNQFGALLPDLTPAPAFVALSACANILGEAEPLGRFPAGDVQAWVFRTPAGLVLAAWAGEQGEIAVPAGGKRGRLLDMFGDPRPIEARNGEFRVPVGPDTVYLYSPGRKILGRLVGAPPPDRRPGKARREALAVAMRVKAEFEKERDAYRAGSGEISGEIEVVNLDGKKPARGRVELEFPRGWSATPSSFPMDLAPMGRSVLPFILQPAPASLEPFTVTATARPARGNPAGVPVAFIFDDATFRETASRPLAWGEAGRWKTAEGGSAGLAFAAGPDGFVRVRAKRAGRGDWWLEAECRLDAPEDLAGYDAVSCELTGSGTGGEQFVFLIIEGPDGISHMTGNKVEAAARGKPVRYLFRDLGLGSSRATRVRMGVWTGEGEVDFEAGKWRLIKLVPGIDGR